MYQQWRHCLVIKFIYTVIYNTKIPTYVLKLKGHICPAQQPFIWIARVREGWATKKTQKHMYRNKK
jgi:hypothetical protein